MQDRTDIMGVILLDHEAEEADEETRPRRRKPKAPPTAGDNVFRGADAFAKLKAMAEAQNG